MKWTNRGHELDELGARYVQVRNLYIWGAVRKWEALAKLLGWLGFSRWKHAVPYSGEACVKFLRWLGIADDFQIRFVDSASAKWGTDVCGYRVISPNDFFASVNASDVVVITPLGRYDEIVDSFPANIRGGMGNVFNWSNINNKQTNEFIRHFLCVYLLYKYDKLLSHWANYNVTTRCNLNCKNCLNFSGYINVQQDKTFDDFKNHIDVVFSKFDYLYSLHFTGGESLLNKDLCKMLKYIGDEYGDRVYDLFFITNGTLIPNQELLDVLRQVNCWVIIDDYSASVPKCVENVPKLPRPFHKIFSLNKNT
ncbi:hypothetical protein AGMMS50276_30180 [Synergistales bacterium]|nr:hypothetical protein AGMMS50276_30180 [Synergistales bacterium]